MPLENIIDIIKVAEFAMLWLYAVVCALERLFRN